MLGYMLTSTHRRLMAEQVIADNQEKHELRLALADEMAAFKTRIVEQAAIENQRLKAETVELKAQIAALNGKLVHHIAQGGEAYKAVDGMGR